VEIMLFDFSDYDQLLPLVTNSLLAAALLGLMGGLIGIFVMTRDSSFAVHGISEISFAGAAVALLIGIDVVLGSVIGSAAAAILIGLLGTRAKDRNSIIAVLMPFGLGIGILALSLYEGRSSNKFGLLTGQIIAIDEPSLFWLTVICIFVILTLLFIWRPLQFASLDQEVAKARGVATGRLGFGFLLLLGLAVAASVQVVGALLVLSLLVTPAAAALRVTSSPKLAPVLSVVFAVTSAVGGILLALGGGLPVSPYITSISFAIYLLARLYEVMKKKTAKSSVVKGLN
jgi:zinc/manganese transport system permease protein